MAGDRDLTEAEQALLQAQVSLSSALTLFGCIAILVPVLREHKESVAADRLVKKLLIVLCIIHVCCALCMISGHLVSVHPIMCDLQGFGIQWFTLASVLWNCCIAFNLFNWIVLKKPLRVLGRSVKFYLLLSIGATFVVSIFLLNSGTFGPDPIWCWITIDHRHLRFYCFYMILILAWFFNGSVLVLVARTVCRHTTRVGREAAKYVCLQQMLLMFVFIFCWMFGLISRVLETAHKPTPFWALYLHALFVPLHGFFTALVYVGLRWCLHAHKVFVAQHGQSHTDHKAHGETRSASIFAVTYNLGEADLKAVRPLGRWIPPGHDMYILALQECVIPLEELEATIKAHLRASGVEYAAFREAIGHTHMGFHGLIAVLIFVPKNDVDQGALAVLTSMHKHVKGGAKVGPYVAANKGMVGFAVRFYGVTLAVLGGHLASDSKGHVRFEQRNQLMREALHRSVLTDVDINMDVNLLFHHTILLGDLNYRIRSNPQVILNAVAAAALEERRHLFNAPDWTRKRYARMFPGVSQATLWSDATDAWEALNLTADDVDRMTRCTSSEAASKWESLLEEEELTMAMRDQLVLHNFTEHPIRFPPSFRRKRGMDEGDCGDYCDVTRLQAAYTTSVNDMKRGATIKESFSSRDSLSHNHVTRARGHSSRPPSYTDRILAHSLPDCQAALVCSAYELCDAATGSDHRPVAAVFHLTYEADYRTKPVNMHLIDTDIYSVSVENIDIDLLEAREPSCENLLTLAREASEPLDVPGRSLSKASLRSREDVGRVREDVGTMGGAAGSHPLGKVAAAHWTGLLPMRQTSRLWEAPSDPSVMRKPSVMGHLQRSRSLSGVFGLGSPKRNSRDLLELGSVTLTFPIPPEDPLGSAERHMLIAEECISLDFADRGGVTAEEGSIESQVSKSWKELQDTAAFSNHLRRMARASPQLGMHAGISVSGPHGQAIGQAVLCLKEALDSPDCQSEVMEPLVLGGRLVGYFHATVIVHAGKNGNGSTGADGNGIAQTPGWQRQAHTAEHEELCSVTGSEVGVSSVFKRMHSSGSSRSRAIASGGCGSPMATATAVSSSCLPAPQCIPRPLSEQQLLAGRGRSSAASFRVPGLVREGPQHRACAGGLLSWLPPCSLAGLLRAGGVHVALQGDS